MKTLIAAALLCVSLYGIAQDNDALIKSCLAGDLAAVKQSVESGANINYKNAAGQTPLAVSFFWPEQTSYLLSKGAEANGGDYPALVNASRFYSQEVMKLLLAAGADPNKPGVVNVDIAGPMKKLVEEEKAKGKKANKTLIKAYEDQIAKMPASSISTTALQSALGGTNCKACVELLLNAGAKTDVKNSITGGNAVHEIAFTWIGVEQRAANIQTNIPYFEKAGMGIPDWYRNLDITSMGTATEIIGVLKAKGADLEHLDNNKRTPLMNAVLQPAPNEEIITALVNNGANMKATGKNNDPTEFQKETADAEKIKVRFDFPAEGRNSNNGGGYSANLELVNPKPKQVALISYYLYDAGKGKTTGGTYLGTATAQVWRTSDFVGQNQVNGFYEKSIGALKQSFKDGGIDLLTPEEFIDTEEKSQLYYEFSQETAKREKTEITKRKAAGISLQSVATATTSTLKIAPAGRGYRTFFVANEGDDESAIANFQGGIFSANRKLTSSLGYDLAKGLGVDAVVVVYIATRKVKPSADDYGVNAVVTMMLGPNPSRSAEGDPEAKNLGQFYCGTRTYYGSPLLFKTDAGIFGQYDGMANILKAHAAKMCGYINGKQKDTGD